MRTPINDKLRQLKRKGRLPFHMPGHKRKPAHPGEALQGADLIRSADITEISGYDNLHHPREMIRESMDQLKEIYHTRESWYLVNGSTLGILAALSAVCRPGDTVVIGRNCHQSVYHAIRLLRLRALYLYPGISREFDLALDYGDDARRSLSEIFQAGEPVRAVLLTSPSYEGVVSDVSAMRELISTYDDRTVLIIDEAHGAHMIFHPSFPESAVACGADLVVQSTHKTLPALTQTALLHLCSDRADPEKVSDWLSVYETSSPSYILMASAESAVTFMHSQGKKLRKYVDNLRKFRKDCAKLLHIHLIDGGEIPVFDYDFSKLVFFVSGMSQGGKWLFDRLRDDWNIELEMAGRSYALAMTSVMDEDEDYAMLLQALKALDEQLDAAGEERHLLSEGQPEQEDPPLKAMESWECDGRKTQLLPLDAACGSVAAANVSLYPPGIPLLVPGEIIIKEMVEKLRFYLYNGYNVQGLKGDRIQVLISDADVR